MIGQSYRRPVGGARYSATQRALGRQADAQASASTLTAAAKAAMQDPDGIRAVADVLFEMESNRLHRPTGARLLVDGVDQNLAAATQAALVDGVDNASYTDTVSRLPGLTPVATVDNVGGWVQTVTSGVEQAATRKNPGVLAYGWSSVVSVDQAVGQAGYLAPAGFTPCRYRWTRGADDTTALVRRRFTVTVGVTSTPNLPVLRVGRMRLETVDSTGMKRTHVGPWAAFFSYASTGSLGRMIATLNLDYPAGTLVTSIRGSLELAADPTYAATIELGELTVYAGDYRNRNQGILAAAHNEDATLEFTFPEGTRRVSQVEVHGPEFRSVTSIAVDWRDPATGAWVPAGETAGAMRLAHQLPGEYVDTTGIRVRIEESSASGIAYVQVAEVDFLWIIDVSANGLVGVETTWARESDPTASTNPVGSFASSTCTLTLEGLSGMWNPPTNTALDVGHRVEVAYGVRYRDASYPGGWVEELLPAGVFYTDPIDTDSTAETVQVNAVDKLGRLGSTAINEAVWVNATVDALVRYLALTYLDMSSDQVKISPTLGSLVIPYAFPTGDVATYLADLAKAVGGTLHVDVYERLCLSARTDTTDAAVVDLTTSTNLIGHKRPPGYDLTTAIVTVTAAPLSLGAVADLWTLPDEGVVIQPGASWTAITDYETSPAINAFVTGIVADKSYTVTSSYFYATRAFITIKNNATTAMNLTAMVVRGNPLVEKPITGQATDAASLARYGPRELTVEAALVQTAAQAQAIATILLDEFRALDDDGRRRLPDAELDTLGILYLEAGDRVTASDPGHGLSGDYVALARTLAYADGAILGNGLRVREAPTGLYAVTDVSLTDDARIAGY